MLARSAALPVQVTDRTPTVGCVGLSPTSVKEQEDVSATFSCTDDDPGVCSNAVISWGDDSSESCSFGMDDTCTPAHKYATAGTYTAKITVVEGGVQYTATCPTQVTVRGWW